MPSLNLLTNVLHVPTPYPLPGFFGFVAEPLFKGMRVIFAEAVEPHLARMQANKREWQRLTADAGASSQRGSVSAVTPSGPGGEVAADVFDPVGEGDVAVDVSFSDS